MYIMVKRRERIYMKYVTIPNDKYFAGEEDTIHNHCKVIIHQPDYYPPPVLKHFERQLMDYIIDIVDDIGWCPPIHIFVSTIESKTDTAYRMGISNKCECVDITYRYHFKS